MPGFSFIYPELLLLLALLVPVWALSLAAPRRLRPWRFWTSLLLRSLAIVLLTLSLAGTQLITPVDRVSAVFLVDGSNSIAPSQRARAETFVREALAAMPEDGRAGIVVFGGNALVERSLSSDREVGQLRSLPEGSQTNIADAIQLGLAMLPAEGRQRLVLLSDGGETEGSLLEAARIARSRGVPLEVVQLSGAADGLDAQIAGLELPASAREGQQLRLVIRTTSSAATSARLQVDEDGQLLADQEVQVPAGDGEFEVLIPPTTRGFHRYRVRLQAANDARLENNVAEAFSFVAGPPRILLVEGSPGEAEALSRALAATSVEVVTVPPAEMPASLAELSTYEALLLVNVPYRALPRSATEVIPSYVRDLGRGLVMVGGDESFGAGGYRGTPIEEALPVEMEIQSPSRFPAVSIVVVMDTSGSMSQIEDGFPKIQLANEGAARIAAMIRDNDEVTVIPFDTAPNAIIGPFPGTRRQEAVDEIVKIGIGVNGGGILVRSSLERAAEILRASDKPIRHIVLLSDGADSEEQEGVPELVGELAEEKITVSTVSIGVGSDTPFLERTAQQGLGRYFLADRAGSLPTILAQEAEVVLRPYVVEETFVPTRVSQHPILSGIDAAPQLQGYVAAQARRAAQTVLVTSQNDPLLVTWQYGLGRSAAWTSDLKGQWARDWLAWEEFPRFAAQLTGWTLPAGGGEGLTLEAGVSEGNVALTLNARGEEERPQTGLQVSGRMIAADGNSFEVSFSEVEPGRYRSVASQVPPGAYLVQLQALDAAGQAAGSVTAGAVVPPSAEYRRPGGDLPLLEEAARLTGGREELTPPQVFDATGLATGTVQEIGRSLLWLALILLPLDVAVRRLLVRGQQIQMAANPTRMRERLANWQTQRRARQASAAATAAPATQPVAGAEPTTVRRRPPVQEAGPSDGQLERLRAAQERARRRARGEE
jgi:uncharacterized membrane protein